MKIFKTLAIAAAFSSASIAFAAITMADINNANISVWTSLGDLNACSLEFPDMEASLAAMKLDKTVHRLVSAADFGVTNFDEVHPMKVELMTQVSVSVMKGMALLKETESQIRQRCQKAITDSEALQKRLEAKISNAEKKANRKTIATEQSKSKERGFVLMVSLLFTNTNAKDIRNSLQKVPVNRSFASEEECTTYLSWRISNTEPGIMGGGWIAHPNGKQIVCESR